MKKAWKVIGITAGGISLLSAIILGCIYMGEISDFLRIMKIKVCSLKK